MTCQWEGVGTPARGQKFTPAQGRRLRAGLNFWPSGAANHTDYGGLANDNLARQKFNLSSNIGSEQLNKFASSEENIFSKKQWDLDDPEDGAMDGK